MPWKSDQIPNKISSSREFLKLRESHPEMSNSEIMQTYYESKNMCDTTKLLEITTRFISYRFNKPENLLAQFFLRKKWKKSFEKVKK